VYSSPDQNWSGLLYKCDNVTLTYELAKLDVHTPADMRAPGAPLGIFALESAMDELAYAKATDPIDLRLRNYAERNENEGKDLPARNYAPATKWARSVSAGRAARPSRARCATGASLSGSAWQRRVGVAAAENQRTRRADRRAYSRPADHHRQAVALTRAPRLDRLGRRRPTIYGFIVATTGAEGRPSPTEAVKVGPDIRR